ELIAVKGITYLGPLPDDIQLITVFSGGVHSQAKNPAGAAALLKFGTGNQEGWHGARLRLHGRCDDRFLAAHSGVRRELGTCRSGCAPGAAWAAPVIPSTQPRRP